MQPSPSPEVAAKLQERYAKIALADQTIINANVSLGVWAFFQDSEQQLIQLMNGNPPAPSAPGNIEASWALYYIQYHAPSWVVGILKKWGMPPTQITPQDWSTWDKIWSAQGVLTGDGSLVSYALYAVLDVGWSLAFIDYLLIDTGYSSKHAFKTVGTVVNITGQDTLRVGMFGDWGTGAYTDGKLPQSPSQMIGSQLESLAPDLSIHLGDVYYAGDYLEETICLVNCSKPAPLGNFTLNSNHEMYDGANGLFDTALTANIFAKQQQSTFFSISFGNWMIIGLDTAYYDTSTMFMVGALTDSNQVNLLRQAGASGKKIFIVSHHNPLSEQGDATTSLWGQVVGALGKNPDYWYWGHIHNGIVYSQVCAGAPVACRCLGNGAIPIGDASWFKNQSTISYYTSTALSNPTIQQQLRVLNGFAVLEFTEDDVQETWYNQDGTKAWQS